MEITLSGTDSGTSELAEIYKRHVKTVYRVCYTYMKNGPDTEDAVADTFVKLIANRRGMAARFDSVEHEKAWLIRAAINVCKDELKHWRRGVEPLTDAIPALDSNGDERGDVLQAVLALPERYKSVVYLYYYEGYDSAEIAAFLKKPKSTIRNHLHEARAVLRERLGEDYE
jgi:RNA polymerase sigma-70 factor (ECF subfamily)